MKTRYNQRYFETRETPVPRYSHEPSYMMNDHQAVSCTFEWDELESCPIDDVWVNNRITHFAVTLVDGVIVEESSDLSASFRSLRSELTKDHSRLVEPRLDPSRR